MIPTDPKIQDLVEEYFKRPLTPEENQRLSDFLSRSPEETQRFAARLEVLNSQGGSESAGTVREIGFKDIPTGRRTYPSWVKPALVIFLLTVGIFIYWRLTSPLPQDPQGRSSMGRKDQMDGKDEKGSVKVFQSKKSLPPPQISTPVPFRDPASSEASH